MANNAEEGSTEVPSGTRDPRAGTADTISQICGGITHDFNNLLTILRGNLLLLSLDDRLSEDGEAAALLAAARSAADEAALRTRGLALMVGERAAVSIEPIDLNAMVRRQAAAYGDILGRRIRLALDLAEGLPPVLADSEALAAVLLALAVNARDAIDDQGSLVLATDLLPGGPAAQARARLRVIDTGRGMGPAEAERAADVLYTSRLRSKAAGLGLSLSARAAQAMGGTLTIDSRPGAGTSVSLALPLSPAGIAPPVERYAAK